jgi:hypothetical protein
MVETFGELFDPFRWPAGLVFFALAAVSGVWMARAERRMKSVGRGIVAYELARTPAAADRILEAWGAEGRKAAQTSCSSTSSS